MLFWECTVRSTSNTGVSLVMDTVQFGLPTSTSTGIIWLLMKTATPRALVGLAMQVDSVQDPMVTSGAMPNIALYITGSADECPATENVIPVLENVDGLAWQILHSLEPTTISIKIHHRSGRLQRW